MTCSRSGCKWDQSAGALAAWTDRLSNRANRPAIRELGVGNFIGFILWLGGRILIWVKNYRLGQPDHEEVPASSGCFQLIG